MNSVTLLPISTFVLTVAVVSDLKEDVETAPPLHAPTLSCTMRLAWGRIEIPPGLFNPEPDTIFTLSPSTTFESMSIVMIVPVMPPFEPLPDSATTPPPATCDE